MNGCNIYDDYNQEVVYGLTSFLTIVTDDTFAMQVNYPSISNFDNFEYDTGDINLFTAAGVLPAQYRMNVFAEGPYWLWDGWLASSAADSFYYCVNDISSTGWDYSGCTYLALSNGVMTCEPTTGVSVNGGLTAILGASIFSMF